MASKMEQFNWFCGKCSPNTSLGENCSNFTGFEWDDYHTIDNACFVNLLGTLPHLFFILIGSLVLFTLACCCGLRHQDCRYLIKQPGHNIRWLLYYFLVVVSLMKFGEGILTDLDTNAEFPTQPFLYVVPLLGLVAVVLSIVYYHHLEYWRHSWMSWVLLSYWLLAIAAEALQFREILHYLQSNQQGFLDGVKVLRFDLAMASLFLYSIYVILEFNLMCHARFNTPLIPDDLKRDNMRYLQGYSNLLSTAVFWWLNWVFKKGYKEALELSDLGSLPKIHTACVHRNKFEDALSIEEEIARKAGKKINLYKVYARTYGWRLASAGVVKFIGDSLNFVVPIILKQIIAYAGTLNQKTGLLEGDLPEQPSYVAVSEFFRNGAILVVGLFIASYTRALCLQLHYHIVITESAHVKAALQASVYDKALRLSTFAISGGMMTSGQITNHISVDTNNIVQIFQFGHYFWSVPYQAAVYDKALRLSTFTISGGMMTTGQITNHISVDANNINMVFQWVHYCWSIPYQLIGYLLLLYNLLGYVALLGSLIFFICIPIQTVIAKKLATFQKKKLSFGDDRLKQTNEMLQGIKLIKLYAWEEIFLGSIGQQRNQELSMLLHSTTWRVCLYTVTTAAPLLVTLFIVTEFIETLTLPQSGMSARCRIIPQPELMLRSIYLVNTTGEVCYGLYQTLTGKALAPDITFASLSIFNNMFVPLIILPNVFTWYANAMVSTARLRTFFSAPEVEMKEDGRRRLGFLPPDEDVDDDDEDVDKNLDSVEIRQGSSYRRLSENEGDRVAASRSQPPQAPQMEDLPEEVDIRITGGRFAWDSEAADPILDDMNIDIPAGKLTIVVGQVGMGKSSLLSAFLGEMSNVRGTVQWNSRIGSVAYAAQKAWLLNTSLKDNILFGNELDEGRYKDVITACSLQPDIDILPAGDQTEIGEKGINLSGGQKQRVSVARAIYSPHDVVLLDDPLSALDAHVGAHLFAEGIMNILLKQGRTVVLVTHQLQYLSQADQVIVLKDGRVQITGTYESITEENPELAEGWNSVIKQMSEVSEQSEEETNEERASLSRQASLQLEDLKKLERARKASIGSQEDIDKEEASDKGKLIEKEERVKGSVSWQIYWTYIKSFNVILFLLCASLAILQNAATVGTNFVLSDWTNENSTSALAKYLPLYGGLSLFGIILQSVSTGVIFLASLRAARNIHSNMLKSIICSPMRFFDTTPIGRILNRFSSDTQVIDLNLGQTINSFIRFTISCIGAIIVNAIVVWYFIFAIIPIVILYLLLMKFFISTSRELQRLESISRSPVFAHFSESLGGLMTIRAYDVSRRFEKDILKKIEKNNTAYLYLQTSNRWLGTRLDFIGALISLIAGVVSLAACYSGSIASSAVGLAITYALSISSQLNWVIRMAADMEMQMNAVERTSYYTDLESEDYDGIMCPPAKWPSEGHIMFEGVRARYAATLDPVLHGVDVHFKAGENIGICGRTGSGKSSLTLALFRMIDLFEGRILIDGQDISQVPLTQLRGKIAIIPQDPVLFTGSIRFNIDPFDERTDDELWESLEIAQLKRVVTELEGGLDGMVTEGGENFSVGQRQLFCLARAFLRKSRILVMDEATASIDMETDAILQKVVATAFKDRTVLTIAHRVATILDSDKILTLDDGNLKEYDHPETLLANKDSIFASLVNAKQ